MHRAAKTDEFSEKFQTAFGADFWVACASQRVLCFDFSLNIVEKHTLKRPLCINFMLEKPCLKIQILQYNFGLE